MSLRINRINRMQLGQRVAAVVMTLCVFAGAASADVIDIRLEAAADTYNPGDVVEINILANTSSSLVAYGFDLEADSNLLYTGFDAGDGFVGVSGTPDGDGIVGLSFGGGVQGDDLLIGTARFDAVSVGQATIELTTTLNDLTEGFAQAGSGFFDISATSLTLSIVEAIVPTIDTGGNGGGGGGGGNPPVPEPATVILIVSGLLSVARRRN